MLNLKTLTLENFGPITAQKVLEFKPGFNLLLARNGSGKSTSFKAVEMLLADSYQGAYENYINNKKDSFFIELEFEFGGKTYFTSLTCRKGKSANTTERKIQDGDRKDLASGEEAKEFLTGLMDKTVLKYALIVKQKPEDNIVTCGDSERQLLYKKIKDIDYSKEVTTKLEPRIEATKKEIEDINKEIYSLEHQEYNFQEEKDLPLSAEDLEKYQQELKVLISRKELQELTKKTYSEKVEKSKGLEAEIALNQERKDRKEAGIREYETKILYLKDKAYQELSEPLIQKQNEVRSQLEALVPSEEEEKKTLSDGLDVSKGNLKKKLDQDLEIARIQFETDSGLKRKEIKDLEDKVSTLVVQKIKRFDDNLLVQKSQEWAVITNRQAQLAKEIVSFESGICPTCGGNCTHKLEESLAEQKQLEEEGRSKQEEINILTEEKSKNQKAIETNDKNKEDKEKLNSQLETRNNELKNLESGYQNKNQTLTSDYNFQVSSLQNTHDSNLKLLVSKFENKKTTFETELVGVKARIENLSVEIKANLEKEELNKKTLLQDWTEYNQVVQAKTKELEETKLWLAENPSVENDSGDEERIKTLSQEIKNYSDTEANNILIQKVNKELTEKQVRDKKTLEEKNKTKRDKMEHQLHLETAKTILLKDFPNFIIDSTIQETEDNMNQFIDDVYYKSLGVELRPTKTSVKLEYGEGERKIPGFQLSGAESKLVDISFKSYYNGLAELDCLLFDEPDSAMDSENRSKLYEAFLEMGEKIGQIIVVSHSQEMVNYIKNSVETNIVSIE